jgi:hypothetical protein
MAKVKIEPGKTMASPKSLARQLLGGKGVADEADVKALTQKIKEKNKDIITKKGQDLTSDIGPIKVGKINTTLKTGNTVKLVDPNNTNKYSFVTKTSSEPSSSQPSSSVSATPSVPVTQPAVSDTSVKSPSPDLIQIDRLGLPKNLMLRLALEKIGAQELITLVRHDTVNGQSITYQPVKNLSDIAIAYNPQNIIKIPDTSNSYFKNFAIQIENHIPQFSNDSVPVSVYLQNSGIVIDLINLKADYEVEVQTMASGKIFNATIYEEDVS